MLKKTHCDIIKEGDNVIIGLGDSFTQGLGAYSLDCWKAMNSSPATYNISGQYFLDEQGKNNWVSQLCHNHLPTYKRYNFGMNGGGNRASISEMILNPLPRNLGNVIVILMATGVERFDFLKQSDDTAGPEKHLRWQTIWPVIGDRGPISIIEKEYLKQIWSTRNDALEFVLNVVNCQNFCRLNGYKFLFASAFDPYIQKNAIIHELDDRKQYHELVDWDAQLLPECPGPYKTFMNMVRQEEGITTHLNQLEAREYYSKLALPAKYITPCFHWSIEGVALVAKYLHGELIRRKMV